MALPDGHGQVQLLSRSTRPEGRQRFKRQADPEPVKITICCRSISGSLPLASRKDQDEVSLPTAAAGAADIANVLSLLAGELPVDGLEDVMVTFRNQLYVIRLVSEDLEPNIILLVILDRARANLAMARREIRNFCVKFAA